MAFRRQHVDGNSTLVVKLSIWVPVEKVVKVDLSSYSTW